MLTSLRQRLTDLPYFRTLSAERVAALAERAIERTFEMGETICRQDEESAGLWIIESGRVKVFRLNPDGREHILLLMGPGDSFNEIPAIDGGLNPAHVVALSYVHAWCVSHSVLRAEIEADPEMALAIIDILAQRTRKLVQRIEDLALCSVTTRLARFLLEQQTNEALSGPGITRVTIAAHLATTPETLSRALRTLEELGAIDFDREQITIVQGQMLSSLAQL